MLQPLFPSAPQGQVPCLSLSSYTCLAVFLYHHYGHPQSSPASGGQQCFSRPHSLLREPTNNLFGGGADPRRKNNRLGDAGWVCSSCFDAEKVNRCNWQVVSGVQEGKELGAQWEALRGKLLEACWIPGPAAWLIIGTCSISVFSDSWSLPFFTKLALFPQLLADNDRSLIDRSITTYNSDFQITYHGWSLISFFYYSVSKEVTLSCSSCNYKKNCVAPPFTTFQAK